jgi:hypothetical protein
VTTSPSEYQEIPQRFLEKCKVYISEAVTRATTEVFKEELSATTEVFKKKVHALTNLFYTYTKKV